MVIKKITSTKDILSRNASNLCNLFNHNFTYDTTVHIKKEDEDRLCSAKSLLGLLSLAIRKGDEIQFLINGTHEQEVCNAIDTFFEGE